jgi:hypothetical protein
MHIRSITFLCLSLVVELPVLAISDLESLDKVNIVINGAEYNLEIAKTQPQRSQGLMHRQSLAEKEGMLFIYPGSGDHRIWMRNTLIPLTVIWLDRNEWVIAVKQLQPCDANFCPSYGVSRSSKFIIELKAGSHGIRPGDRITGLNLLE